MEQIDPTYMIGKLRETMPPADFEAFQDEMTRIRSMDEIATAWRMEADLREFAPTKPTYCLFEYPLHVYDEHGILSGLHADGEKGNIKGAREAKASKKPDFIETFETAFARVVLNKDEKIASRKEMAEEIGCTEKWLKVQIDKSEDFFNYFDWTQPAGKPGWYSISEEGAYGTTEEESSDEEY